MRRFRIGVPLLSLLLAFLMQLSAAAQGKAPDETHFKKGLSKIQTQMKRGRFKAALQSLTALLQKHERRPWAYSRREDIREWTRRCAFRVKHPVPDADDLVSGDLLAWKPSSGRIKLRYGRTNRSDFKLQRGSFIHPIEFRGPYTITIKGTRYPRDPNRSPAINVCWDSEGYYSVVFGSRPVDAGDSTRWLPAAIIRQEKDDSTELFSKEMSIARAGKPYRLEVKVGRKTISAAINGRRFAQVKKPAKLFGGFGFRAADWKEVTVQGVAEPAWIQHQQDAASQEKLATFRKNWTPGRHLPAWLFEERKPAATRSYVNEPQFPPDVKPRHLAVLEKATRWFLLEEVERAISYLEGLSDDHAPESARRYLLGQFHLQRGDPERALKDIDRSLELQPAFAKSREVRAYALEVLHREAEAVSVWRSLARDHPDAPRPYQEAARLLLLDGGIAEARKLLDVALARNLKSPELSTLERTLVKAQSGPEWGRTFEIKTRNYHILSDIDRSVCKQAADVLEQANTAWRVHIKDSRRKGKRFKVFLFSGERGYAAYTQDVLGVSPHQTAGLYSPLLKQLLIWNLPDREAMLRTVRHEGFHQYLDGIVHDAPSWFNEGMAEYYETARMVNGSLRGGQPRPDHVKRLHSRKPASLDRILYQTQQKFYAGGVYSYAQGWALVHFLRESTAANRKIFKRLLERMQEGYPVRKAIDAAFEGVDRKAFEEEFRSYVSRL